MCMPFFLFVFVCIEIAILIKLGQFIGGGAVIGEILLSGVLGLVILQLKGRQIVKNVSLNVFIGRLTLRSLLRRELLPLTAGILLILPGIMSDVYGLYLFIRSACHRFPSSGGPRNDTSPSDETIDVEYQVHDDQ